MTSEGRVQRRMPRCIPHQAYDGQGKLDSLGLGCDSGACFAVWFSSPFLLITMSCVLAACSILRFKHRPIAINFNRLRRGHWDSKLMRRLNSVIVCCLNTVSAYPVRLKMIASMPPKSWIRQNPRFTHWKSVIVTGVQLRTRSTPYPSQNICIGHRSSQCHTVRVSVG